MSGYPPKGDPFFEQLKADIQEGIDSADRCELFSDEQVRAHFEERSNKAREAVALHTVPEDATR